ncbi:MAG: tetratricopeptide repeat protein, partial [Thermoplasmatales archaeon]|nr:tetratricopeptide repeat protein [Thermoplasmatales archaeon]
RKIVVIYGMPGIGKSVLLSKIVEEYKNEKNIFYYNIHEWDTLRSILEPFSDFLQRMGERKLGYYLKSKPNITMGDIGIILEEELKNCNSLLVFDDTQKANKEITSLFEFLREILPKTNTNLIIAGRKKLGFYDARHILHKIVGEIKLNGLDKKSSKELVGKKITDKDFEKIYSITKGHPLALELIGTEKGIEKEKDVMKYLYDEVFSRLIPQEKDLMFFVSVFNRPVLVDMLLQNNFAYENVQELIKKNLLLESGQEMVHPHDLLRQFFYNKSPVELRIKNHRKAAEHYEGRKGDMDIITAMYHHLKANNQKQAVKIMIKNSEKLINKGYTDETMNILREFDEKKIQKQVLTKILLLKGDIYSLKGELNNAIDSYRRSLKLCEKIKDNTGTAKSYLKIGDIYWMKSEWDTSLGMFNRGLNMSKKINNPELTAEGYHGLGKTYWRKGELDLAKKYFNLCFKHTVDNDLLLAKNYTGLGTINMDQGRYDTAITLYNKALKYFDEIGKKYETIRMYNNLAVTYARKKEYNKAVEYHVKQISLAESLGDFRGMAYGLIGVSGDYAEMNMLEKALDYCKRGLSLAEKLNEKLLISLAHNQYGLVLGKKKTWEKAIENFNTSIRVAREIGSITRLADTYFDYASMLKTKGDCVKAKTQYQNALKCYEKLGNKIMVKEIMDELAEYEKKG